MLRTWMDRISLSRLSIQPFDFYSEHTNTFTELSRLLLYKPLLDSGKKGMKKIKKRTAIFLSRDGVDK